MKIGILTTLNQSTKHIYLLLYSLLLLSITKKIKQHDKK